MGFFDAAVLGIVEGITEFLPISSTAHLALASKLLGLPQSEFVKSFEIAIQLGAILAVLYLYLGEVKKNLGWIKKIIAAFLPTAIIGYLFYKVIKGFLLENYSIIVWALIIGGIAMIALELIIKEKSKNVKVDKISDLSYKKCVLIGLFQSISIVPGVSRAAATILGGLSLGMSRKLIVEFSFLLAVPTMLAATGYDLLKSPQIFVGSNIYLLIVGLVISFIIAILSIKFLLSFVRKNNFISFGIYRIIIGLIFLIFVL